MKMIIKKLLKNGCFWENLDVLVDIVIYFFEIECLFFFERYIIKENIYLFEICL